MRKWLKQLFCSHIFSMYFRDYPDRCEHYECRKCGKIKYVSFED